MTTLIKGKIQLELVYNFRVLVYFYLGIVGEAVEMPTSRYADNRKTETIGMAGSFGT